MTIYKTGFVPATQTEAKTAMASAVQNSPAVAARRERKLVEVTAPEQYKFEQDGQQLEGYLIGCIQIEVKGKPALEYTVLTEERKKVTFLGTWDLDRKFKNIGFRNIIRRFIVVTFLFHDDEVKTQGSLLKRFRLEYDASDRLPDARQQQNNPEITDDDIPF